MLKNTSSNLDPDFNDFELPGRPKDSLQQSEPSHVAFTQRGSPSIFEYVWALHIFNKECQADCQQAKGKRGNSGTQPSIHDATFKGFDSGYIILQHGWHLCWTCLANQPPDCPTSHQSRPPIRRGRASLSSIQGCELACNSHGMEA